MCMGSPRGGRAACGGKERGAARLDSAAASAHALQLFTSGKRQVGVLFGPETAGTHGRHAYVWNLPFAKPMPVAKAVANVLWEVRRKGHVTLELKMREDYFKVLYAEHAAESSEAEENWARLVKHTAPKSHVDAMSRFATARVVLAPTEAGLAGAAAAAVGEVSE